jgi:hypothetical protein
MDEYIKREDAVSAICFGCNLEFSDRPCEPPDCEIRHAIEAIRAADVVPVVRCKDCKHFERGICYYPTVRYVSHDKNHFCGYGEKKGGAK